ncbi:hypothetical protein [Streptomyces sp. NPDC055287]
MRPLLAERGCIVASGLWLRTLAEVIDHLGADGQTGIIDGTVSNAHNAVCGAGELAGGSFAIGFVHCSNKTAVAAG